MEMNKETRSFNFEVRAEENEQHGAHLVGEDLHVRLRNRDEETDDK